MASSFAHTSVFFPKADAAVLSCRLAPPPTYPETVGPVYDPDNVNTPVLPWSSETHNENYPPPKAPFTPAPIPDKHICLPDRYLRASLAKNERLRLSMLWYYTSDIFKETEFLSGLQEKVCIAHEATGWEFAIIGILDLNFYVRLATVGVPLGILPRGETICAHTVAQPPGSVFLLPNLLEDWRFEESPYVESGGLRAYAGAPLRLQNESGETVCFGSICVASPTRQESLTRAQQTTLARLADWVVSDIVQLTRARRQRARRQMVDLIAAAQAGSDGATEESIFEILKRTYPDAVVSLQSSKAGHIEVEGRGPVPIAELADGLWEDIDHIDDFIAKSNHLELPTDRVVRIIAAQCESVSGPSFLAVASKDFRLVFDDIDAWFVQTCAGIISHVWNKRVLNEVMLAKEKFLRGFSHQLRTPIHGILGSVELLAEELKLLGATDTSLQSVVLANAAQQPKSGGEPRMYLDTIKSAGRDLISVVNSMITLNRWADVAITERQYATHTLYELETELANELLKSISGDSRYHASIFFNHDQLPDQWSIRTDLRLLRDSVLPLIINAVQNTPEGVVTISMTTRPDTKELVIDVKDTGRGIPSDDHQRIFELYEQVDAYSTGAGLGLTLASKFAALLKGSVELVSSEVGRGSHFRATFQNVDLQRSDSSLLATPSLLELVNMNMPRRFHAISPNSKISSCEHVTKILTCYGFVPSNDANDALIILDFVPDADQLRAALSQLPADQVAICLVPFSEQETRLDHTIKNVVYVHGPFLTRTMSSALERADKLLTLIKANQVDAIEPTRDQIVVPRLDEPVRQEPKNETTAKDDATQTDNSTQEVSKLQIEKAINDISLEEPASTPEPCQPVVVQDTNTTVTSVPPPSLTTIMPTPPTSIFPHPSSTTHPLALLVDDNAINLRVMQMYCKKRSLPYLLAKDGLDAVSLFTSHQSLCANSSATHPPIQLILMDLQMPRCDGIEATRRIRQKEREMGWGEAVVWIVTGQDSVGDRNAAREEGVRAQEYYVKPVGVGDLDRGLGRWFKRE